MKNGPIILVEDDADDQEFLVDALQLLQIHNEIKIFENGQKALEFLKVTTEQPFLIISDVNLPVLNGLQLKSEIESNQFLKSKSIPFVILSTSADVKAVSTAFKLSVQGFFIKENTYEGIKKQVKQIVEYWQGCQRPIGLEA